MLTLSTLRVVSNRISVSAGAASEAMRTLHASCPPTGTCACGVSLFILYTLGMYTDKLIQAWLSTDYNNDNIPVE